MFKILFGSSFSPYICSNKSYIPYKACFNAIQNNIDLLFLENYLLYK